LVQNSPFIGKKIEEKPQNFSNIFQVLLRKLRGGDDLLKRLEPLQNPLWSTINLSEQDIKLLRDESVQQEVFSKHSADTGFALEENLRKIFHSSNAIESRRIFISNYLYSYREYDLIFMMKDPVQLPSTIFYQYYPTKGPVPIFESGITVIGEVKSSWCDAEENKKEQNKKEEIKSKSKRDNSLIEVDIFASSIKKYFKIMMISKEEEKKLQKCFLLQSRRINCELSQ